MATIRNYSYSAKLQFWGNINQTAYRGYIGPEIEFDGNAFEGDSYWQECECNCPHCYDNGDYVETDADVDRHDFADEIADIFCDHDERFLVFKEDGSVRGVEINVQPMTYEFMYRMHEKFDRMFLKCHRHEINSPYESHSAGMHVHMSYTMFQSDDHVKKFVQLFELMYDEVFEFAKRNYATYCHSCGVDPALATAEFKEEYYRQNRNHVKMQIVNTAHEDTLEVRAFTAPNNVDTYFANIQLCLVFMQLARGRKIHSMTWANVKETARVMGFQELIAELG